MRITPVVSATRPIQCQEHQSRAHNEQETADGVACPSPLFKRHSWVICTLLGPIEGEDSERGGGVKRCLDPENITPSRFANVGDSARSQTADSEQLLVFRRIVLFMILTGHRLRHQDKQSHLPMPYT